MNRWAHLCAALGEQTSEHAVFNIQTILIYYFRGYKMRKEAGFENRDRFVELGLMISALRKAMGHT